MSGFHFGGDLVRDPNRALFHRDRAGHGGRVIQEPRPPRHPTLHDHLADCRQPHLLGGFLRGIVRRGNHRVSPLVAIQPVVRASRDVKAKLHERFFYRAIGDGFRYGELSLLKTEVRWQQVLSEQLLATASRHKSAHEVRVPFGFCVVRPIA